MGRTLSDITPTLPRSLGAAPWRLAEGWGLDQHPPPFERRPVGWGVAELGDCRAGSHWGSWVHKVGVWWGSGGSQPQKDGALGGGGHWGRKEEMEGDGSVWGSSGWPGWGLQGLGSLAGAEGSQGCWGWKRSLGLGDPGQGGRVRGHRARRR